MKRNFVTALFLSLIMVGGMAANAAAADVTFGGQLRPRFEAFEQNDFNDNTAPTFMISTRIRLNVNAKINDKLSAFIQMQARGVYGAGQTVALSSQAGLAAPLVNNRNSAAPSDAVTNVGLHQAYFIINDFFSLPVDVKVGRQEVILDGHRLFGNTGWTQGAQTHDAIRLDHHHGEHTLSYIYISASETAGSFPPTIAANAGGGNTGQPGYAGLFGTGTCAANVNDECDRNEHVLWANLKGILGGALSLYFVATDDNTFNTPSTFGATGANLTAGATLDNNMYTIGLRQAGQLYGIDYRVEGYYQFGEADGITSVAGTAGTGFTSGGPFQSLLSNAPAGSAVATNLAAWAAQAGPGAAAGVDRSAWMYAVRIGKKFNNVMWKPSATIWWDHLSGTDEGDVADNEWSTFDTLYDTGHKYYGFMDTYLNPTGTDTSWMGLRDLAGKFSIQPLSNLTFKADIHAFWTDTDPDQILNSFGIADTTLLTAVAGGAGAMALAPAGSTKTVGDIDGYLGEELDLTLVYKYDPNTTISLGYSRYWADDTFQLVNGRLTGRANGAAGAASRLGSGFDNDASWGYVQFDVKF